MRQVFVGEDLLTPLRDCRAFRRFDREPGHFRQEFVAAHTDERPDAREVRVPAGLGNGA